MTARITPPPDTLLSDYYEQTFRKLRLNGRSAGTHKQYLVNLRHFDRFLGRAATLGDLDDDTVTAFIADRCEKTTPVTANKARNHILALWRFAARKRHVDVFPDVGRLKEPTRIPQSWDHAQLAMLVETAYRGNWFRTDGRFKWPTGGIPQNLWITALILLLYETGIRIGAALGLRVTDVDLQTGRVLVPAEIQKQYADQAFTLTPQTVAILKQFANVERELLLPWHLERNYFYTFWRQLLQAAGLPTGRRYGPHRIRRTTATMAELHIGRGTATSILGHSSSHVTRSYIDTTKLPETRVGERLPRALLVGEFADDGSVPAESELLPAPRPAPAPVEHHVAAIILPVVIVKPDEHPLMDCDIRVLLAEYDERHLLPLTRQYRSRSIRHLRETFAAASVRIVRDIDGQALLDLIRERRRNRVLTGYTYLDAKAAIGSFLRWLIREKAVYAMAPHLMPFDAHWNHGEKARRA